MYHGPFVQTDLARRTAQGGTFAAPLAWGHWIAALAALAFLVAAYVMLASSARRRGEWK